MWIAIQNAVGARQGVGGGPGPTPPPYTPPLDDFTGAIAAFSIRKLSSSYSGFCCQVTRASDSVTLDVPFASSGLIDMDAITAFDDGSGVSLTTWYDQTSSGNDFTGGVSISTTGEKPGLDGGGLNNSGVTIPADFTLVSLNRYRNNAIYFGGASNSTFFNYATTNNNDNLRYRILGGTRDFTVNTRGGTEINIGTRTSGALKVRNQGYVYTTAIPINTSFDIEFIAKFNLYHQEYIFYNSAFTEPQTLSLTQNLNSYYQVTNLPDYTSGFLADYPDAAVAYSVRKLSNTAIKCMRVRRFVPPYDEQDIGFTPAGDLDEAAIVAFGGSDELRVSAWYDQSGNSNHATQIAPNNQPQIYDGAAVIIDNGKPAVEFASDYISAPAFSTPISQPNTYFITVNKTNHSGYLFERSAGTGRQAQGDSTWIFAGSVANGFYPTADLGSQKLFTALFDGADSISRMNNVATGSGNPGTQGQGGIQIGRPTQSLTGKVQEFIMYGADQTDYFAAIESNINGYFDIYTEYNPDPATSGFLFDYPDASSAYSVRQLNNNATYALRVRRLVSPFDELDIGFTPAGDLDETAITTFGGSDELSVSRFYDQTGDQNHTEDVGATAQLRIYDGTNVIKKNGKPIAQIHVSAGNSNSLYNMQTPAPASFTHSLYSVVQRPSAPSALNMFSAGVTGVTALYQERSGNLTYGPGWTSYGIYTYTTVSNQPRLYCYIRKNGTDGECFNDGVSRGTTTAMNASIQINIKGWRSDRGSTGIQADCGGMQEFIAYPDDRTSVGDNTNILSDIKSYFTGIP